MAQLRQDYEQFVQRDTEIVAVGPEDQQEFVSYWQKEDIPFVGLADPDHSVAKQYGQQIKLLKWGRMPALMVIDRHGQIRFKHYGNSMSDIVANSELFEVLDAVNSEVAEAA